MQEIRISQIPLCVQDPDGEGSFQAWLGKLNDHASKDLDKAPDDVFTEGDFNQAIGQDWGKALRGFGSFENFKSRFEAHVAEQSRSRKCSGLPLAGQWLSLKNKKLSAMARQDFPAQLKLEAEAKSLIGVIEQKEGITAQELVDLLEIFLDGQGPNKAFEKDDYEKLGKALESKVRKIGIRSDLVGWLAEQTQLPHWQKSLEAKLPLLLPYLDGMISSPRGVEEESWMEKQSFVLHSLQIAGQIPQLEVAALLGAAHRGVANDQTKALALKLANGSTKRERLAFLFAITSNFPGDAGIPWLLKLSQDAEEEVRGNALQALAVFLPSQDAPKEVKKAFLAALEDARPKIRQLGILAMAKYGKPGEAEALLTKKLDEEKDEETLVLAAQALGQLIGPRALGLLFQRLGKPAPDKLFLEAIQWVDRNRIHQAAPIMYRLILHPSEEVRQAALSTIRRMDDRSVLFALLKDSHNKNPQLRLRSAQALRSYSNRGAAKRLIALLKDPDESVKQEAFQGLKELIKVEPAGSYIRKQARDDRSLRELLRDIIK